MAHTADQYLEVMDAIEKARQAILAVRSLVTTSTISTTHVLVAYHNIVNAANETMNDAFAHGIDLDAARHEREEREKLQGELIF